MTQREAQIDRAKMALTWAPLRPPDQVMRLTRLGAFHQTRLSFMRALLRELASDGWRFERTVWRIDERGEGVAVYAAHGPQRSYSLIAFAHDLDPMLRTDRVIAEAWDATFVLFDGLPVESDIVRLAANAPKQEAGRYSAKDIVLSRANRSVRLFDDVVQCLIAGSQPKAELLESVGYLMRTTAVYANGKFGLVDRAAIVGRSEFAGPFRAEMLTVWLIRAFTIDIVEHVAWARAPQTAVRLAAPLRRRLGVGNATGLGMAPFLVNHPVLLHKWIVARETALARVRSLETARPTQQAVFCHILARTRAAVDAWHVEDVVQAARITELAGDLARLAGETTALVCVRPWDRLTHWAKRNLSVEAQELLVTLMLEPYGDLVDELATEMAVNEDAVFRIDGAMSVGTVRELIRRHYDWALSIDFTNSGESARFWYVSEEKLEPRLGERFEEIGAEVEQPLDIGRAVAALASSLAEYRPHESIASFLLTYPEHRRMVRRAQMTAQYAYAEIRDNLIGAGVRPIDLLRCKLSFFGASRFDPKSDRWTRITMFQYAPYPDELAGDRSDDWVYPPLPG